MINIGYMIDSAIREFGPDDQERAILHLFPAICRLSIWQSIQDKTDWDAPVDELEA
jgi:hypothetical protein